MLRGSSRHDGIPNNQAARERQREKQRQERAQMLPNEDQDLTATTQDLFESPVKVDPNTEDQTSAEIKKQFGNFESVRHYILDNPYYSRRLIGVDQNASSAGSNHGSGGTRSGSTASGSGNLVPSKPSITQHPRSSNISATTSSNSGKSAVLPSSRNFANARATGTSSHQASGGSAQSTGVGGFRSTFVPVPPKSVSANSHQPLSTVASVPSFSHGNSSNNSTKTIQVQNSSSSSSVVRGTTNSESGQSSSVPSANPPLLHQSRPVQLPNSTNVRKPNNQSFTQNTANTASTSGFVTPNNSSVCEVSTSRAAGVTDIANSPQFATPTPKVESENKDRLPSSNISVNSNSATSTSSSSIELNKPVKSDPNERVTKKPTLERVDSQIELENMLKEMMDVKPPLTAIQTPGPANDPQTKKVTQRRSSKGEDIVQSLRESGMTSIPSPVQKMDSSGDSSSSYESDSSDSEDSSSGSQGGGDEDKLSSLPSQPATTSSPTRNWDLSSFIQRGNDSNNFANITKVDSNFPKDSIGRESLHSTIGRESLHSTIGRESLHSTIGRESLHSTIDSEESPGETLFKVESSVTSTSILGKTLTPLEVTTIVLGKSPRQISETRLDSYIPAKPLPPIIPGKGSSTAAIKAKGASLSESSSEDESKSKSPNKDAIPRTPVLDDKRKTASPKKRRKSVSSSPERTANIISSPDSKNKGKKGQDRNKNDSIRNVFRIRNSKVSSPSSVETEGKGKGSPTVSTKGKAGVGKGKTAPKSPSAGTNRVTGKDNGKKNTTKANTSAISVPVEQNGNIESLTGKKTGSAVTAKKKDVPKKSLAQDTVTSKKPQKAQPSMDVPNITVTPSTSSMLPPASKTKDDVKPTISHFNQSSSLICRIPLSKLPKRPRILATTSVPPLKNDKASSSAPGGKDAAIRGRLNYDSSRVGSSSDNASERDLLNLPDCKLDSVSFGADKSKKPARRSRKITSSQKRGRVKPVQDHRLKRDEDSDMPEVSSNVPGYSTPGCDAGLVSTTRTPPVEMDVVQAPDSSLNPPHLQSPIAPPRAVYLSYFEKIEHSEEDDSLDQDSYLETAKGLKHRADKEECGGLAQVFTYLESGLYFILTGIAIEKERPVPSKEAFTMYKDTLHLIRYIGNRFRSRSDSLAESKVQVLGLRCQSLLALKLYKMKAKESKEVNIVMNDHFQKTPPSQLDLAHSPQLSTPSPRSPTSSPASSFLTGLTPSPHHPYQNHQHPTLSRNLYAQIFKHFTNTNNLMTAHEMWEVADNLVERMHLEDFFITIDRIYGPLTLHSSLVELVRYVKHGIRVLKSTAEIS